MLNVRSYLMQCLHGAQISLGVRKFSVDCGVQKLIRQGYVVRGREQLLLIVLVRKIHAYFSMHNSTAIA